MKIQSEALERIQKAPITGPRLAQLFEQLAQETTAAGGVANSFTIDYQHPDHYVDEDTWIPQLILVLRPV